MFSLKSGTYFEEKEITINCATSEAKIRYTIDGSAPSERVGFEYNGMIKIDKSMQIRAIGYKDGRNNSNVTTENYLLKVSEPLFSHESGVFDGRIEVTISTNTVGASIKYTIDDTQPSSDIGSHYTDKINIVSTSKIKAVAFKAGWEDSSIKECLFEISDKTPKPQFNPIGGSYNSDLEIILSCSIEDAVIRYNIDSSINPDITTGTIYNNPILLDKTAVIKAIAYKTGYKPSDVVLSSYIIDTIPPIVNITKKPDLVTNSQNAEFIIGGLDVVSYKYKLDDNNWSSEIDISTSISVIDLSVGTHSISVIGKDSVGNWQKNTEPTTFSWEIDLSVTTAILSNTTLPITNEKSIDIIVSGNGVVSYKYKLDSLSWSSEINSSNKITVNNLAEGEHTLSVVAKNNLGNWQENDYASIFYWTIDSILQIGNIFINSDENFTNSTSVSISIFGSDENGSGVKDIILSNKNDLSDGIWEAFTTNKDWIITSGSGLKTVYYKLRDFAGNVSLLYSDTITLDIVAPTGSILINDNNDYTNSINVELTINASDNINGSGIYQMMISNNSSFTGGSWEDYSITKSWGLTIGDNTKTVYIKFRDYLGNTSSVYSDSIILDTTSPDTPILEDIISGNTYLNGTQFKLSANGSSNIYYTIASSIGSFPSDPDTPTNSSTLYSGAVSLTANVGEKKYFKIKAIGYNSAGNPGSIGGVWSVIIDRVMPSVVTVTPVNNETYVSDYETIVVTFNKDIDNITLTPVNFFVTDGTSNIAGSISYDNSLKKGYFYPSQAFSPEIQYTVTITTGVKDTLGNPFASNWTSTFTSGNKIPYPSGVYSHWKLDEASGNAIDARGNHELTQVGTVSSGAGKVGTSRGGYTTGNYFTDNNDADNELGGDRFLVEGWFKTSLTNSQAICGKYFYNGSYTGGFSIILDNNGKL